MSLRGHISRLASNGIFKDVLRLMAGTLAGRAIMLAAMPFVTRLYSPSDFALLAVYLAVIGLLGAIACLRFEVAIPVAEDEHDAAHLLVLALLVAGVFSTLALAAVLILPSQIVALLGKPALEPWLWLVPLGVLLTGSYAALQFWSTRSRRFASIAKTRFSQAVAGISTMLGMGWVGITPLGLLLGNMFSTSAGSLRLGAEILRSDRAPLRQVTWGGLRATFHRYRRFPLYSTPEALANIAGLQIPILIVAAYAGPEAGFLLLAQQVMATPMALLGSSISQVYVSRAPEARREGNLPDLTLSILKRLIQVGIGPLILVGFLAPILFPYIFGQQWTRSGEVVTWLLPMVVFQLLASPISLGLHVTHHQSWAAILQIGGVVIRVLLTLAIPLLMPGGYVIGFAMGGALFYAIYLGVILVVTGVFRHAGWWRELLQAVLYVLPWAMAGGAIAVLS